MFNVSHGTVVFAGLGFGPGRRADADSNAIPGQDFQHFIRWDKNFAAVVDHREPVAILGAFDGGFGVLFLRLNLIFEALQLGQRVVVQHGRVELLTT